MMWILILYVGVALQMDAQPVGGPTTAQFPTQKACEAALAQFTDSLGTAKGFDQRVEENPAMMSLGPNSRIWTVKGVCVQAK